ncbi:MAG: ABC transporter ATP-binding protein [Spirochaetes bacterium]|nr:MAG: ABC transporter ATP-binding protein [Spirochaetota bacterium]
MKNENNSSTVKLSGVQTKGGSTIIEVRELTRKFGDFTAVDGISFSVGEGEIFGFLGPNGAGKTTTINMLCTLLKPTEGMASVAGIDVSSHPHEVRKNIGLIFQDPSLDDRLTGRENLHFHAMLYNVDRKTYESRSREVLQMVDLTEKADKQVRTYSGGMKRRLEIARGLLHHPKVIFLDEPTIGLDPQTRRHIWNYLLRLREREKITMFMTTHYMEEAENCDRIAIIDHGRIVSLDTPEALKQIVGGDIVTADTSDNTHAGQIIRDKFGLEIRNGQQGQIIIETTDGDKFIPRLIDTLTNYNPSIQVLSINLRRPTLDDVFIKLTGHSIREEEADQAKDSLKRRVRMWNRGR